MSLLNDVLKDLDARQPRPSVDVPAGLRASPGKTGWRPGRLTLWGMVGLLVTGLAIWGYGVRSQSGSVPAGQPEPVQSVGAVGAQVQAAPAEQGDRSAPPEAGPGLEKSGRKARTIQERPTVKKVLPAVDGPGEQTPVSVASPPPVQVEAVAEQRGRLLHVEPDMSATSRQDDDVALPRVAERPVVSDMVDVDPSTVRDKDPPKSEKPERADARLHKQPRRSPAEEAQAIVSRARALASKDSRQARRILEAGVSRWPDQAALREALVRTCIQANDLECARRALVQAKGTLTTGLLGLRGWVEQQSGDAAASVATYAELVQREPDNARWWSGLAIGLEQTGQYGRARRAWAQVVALPEADKRLLEWARRRLAALTAKES